MLELLWQLGILLTVLVFGVKIGLVAGFAGLSKKAAGVIAVNYGAGILILIFLISRHVDTAYKVVYEYIFLIFMTMALISIYTGFHTIKERKLHGKNSNDKVLYTSIVLCLCCFGAVLAAIVLASPFIGVSTAFVGKYVAIYLSLIIMTFYFASGAIIRISKKPFPVLLGNFMLFVGLFFSVSAIVIPNINTVLKSPMNPVNVPSVITLIYVSVVVIMLLFTGFYRAKEKSSLIQ